jgi:acetate kinase
MTLLVLNSGSSSLKFKLYEMPAGELRAAGVVERIGEEESRIHIHYDEDHFEHRERLADHRAALARLETLLPRLGILESFTALGGVGHRVVHGGERFSAPVLVDEKVREAIRRLVPLAPLHNPANLEGIEAFAALAPDTPQVAVFDTAFHQSMPPEAYRYAVPEEWYRRYGVRRYGFHGTSHSYVFRELARRMGRPPGAVNAVTLHLGNGASVCAVREGRSVETSMGMTPLEGLVMGTRSGDIDPAVLFYMNKYGNRSLEELDRELNRESGLKGLGGSNDMREIEARMETGDERAALAFGVFLHRLVKYVGGYAALLGRVDALVFTGGIGEHSARVREALCRRLEILGVEIDPRANAAAGEEARPIHAPDSRIALWVIPTDEEGVIAEETYRLVGGGP